jgi:hypothetical protein
MRDEMVARPDEDDVVKGSGRSETNLVLQPAEAIGLPLGRSRNAFLASSKASMTAADTSAKPQTLAGSDAEPNSLLPIGV